MTLYSSPFTFPGLFGFGNFAYNGSILPGNQNSPPMLFSSSNTSVVPPLSLI